MRLRWCAPDEAPPEGWTVKFAVDDNENARASVTSMGGHWRWAIYDLRSIQGGPEGPFEAFCTIGDGEALTEEMATKMAVAVLELWGHEVQP